jgi:signal transduction histidine kinase
MSGTQDFISQFENQDLERLLALAEFLDIGIWKYNLINHTLDWDTSVYGRYSVDRETFPTPLDFWYQCLTKESLIKAEEKMGLITGGEKHYNATYEIKLPNGEQRYVLARARVVHDEKNAQSFLYGINLDVTEKELVEQENRRLVAELREAQAIAKIGSWTFDLKSQKLTWSHELYQIYEIPEPQPAEKLYGLYRNRIHPDDQSEVERVIQHASSTGEGYVLDYRLVLDGGKTKYVQGVGRVTVDHNGTPVSLSGTCSDRTREIETRNSIENERAKAARNAHLASLGELSAGVAHEINNPLAIIEGNLRLLSHCAHDPELFSSRISLIDGAWRRIAKIVNGLRKFARSGEKPIFQRHSLREIVQDALVLTEMKAKLHGVQITTDLNGEIEIHCDRLHIEQVIINLVNNSIYAARDGAEKWIKISLCDDASFAVLRVVDSGAGISKHHQEKLFTPFFTTKPIGEGTGLGLSITKGIIDEHGGSISYVEDSPHTCFMVCLKKA